ncbi:MAG: effector binding domain-containing protein [Anaerolineaceae bacterium]|nr:effector binding domain-containing protein [Anaerolineaceae bacterium]
MKALDIEFVSLPAYRVAVFSGFGPEPEMIALGKLIEWMNANNILPLKPETRIFGFNNPDPSPGSPNYGYDFWVTLPQDMQVSDAEELAYPGGEYARTSCPGVEQITETWQALNQWIEQSPYIYGKYQWLEEMFIKDNNPLNFDHLDLYMPIQKG